MQPEHTPAYIHVICQRRVGLLPVARTYEARFATSCVHQREPCRTDADQGDTRCDQAADTRPRRCGQLGVRTVGNGNLVRRLGRHQSAVGKPDLNHVAVTTFSLLVIAIHVKAVHRAVNGIARRRVGFLEVVGAYAKFRELDLAVFVGFELADVDIGIGFGEHAVTVFAPFSGLEVSFVSTFSSVTSCL